MITSTDPIADMLTRIRNASTTRAKIVTLPFSNAKVAVLRVLEQAGWIGRVQVESQEPHQRLLVTLKYDDHGHSVIQTVNRISKPGRRVYVRHTDLPIIANNLGIAVISTSKGMMTNKEARKRRLGGEIICEVF